MKKIFIMIFTLCLILTGCNKKTSEPSNESTKPSSSTPLYTNEEIRQKLKSNVFEYQQRIKDKQQITISGNVEAPDLEFEGMHVFKDINVIFENKLNDPYMKLKTDVYLKEDGKLSEKPTQQIELIRQTQNLILKDIVDYVLEDVDENGKKTYSKTVDELGGIAFNALVTGVVQMVKEFEIEEIPETIEYSYNREKVTYGMKFGFKDLEGTELSEMVNMLLGFFPELNELILKFKDDIIINVSDLKLDVPTTRFSVDVSYPAMQGTFIFPILSGDFKINYKTIVRDDVTKLTVDNTYLKAKVGNNNMGRYMKPISKDNVTTYQAGLVCDSFLGIDLTNEDILSQIKPKDFKVTANGATSLKYYNRLTNEEIIVQDDILHLGLLDIVLVVATYPTNANHIISVTKVDGANDNIENL